MLDFKIKAKMFPKIMGIINFTPDSFSDGNKYATVSEAVRTAKKMIADGADIIDVGGESTRPGASPVSAAEELKRVLPIIEKIREEVPEAVISVDTYKAEVAAKALRSGANIINDISGFRFDSAIADVAAEFDCPLVIMHSVGTPADMQEHTDYSEITSDVLTFLRQKIKFAREKGVNHIIADVGIGFGKTMQQNFELLRHHEIFSTLGVPMLLGISRKRFIGEFCGVDLPQERDAETALLTSLLLQKGIDIIRVHNVSLHAKLRKLYVELNNQQ